RVRARRPHARWSASATASRCATPSPSATHRTTSSCWTRRASRSSPTRDATRTCSRTPMSPARRPPKAASRTYWTRCISADASSGSCLPRGPLPAGSYGLPTASAPSAAAKPWGPSCRAGRAAPRGVTRWNASAGREAASRLASEMAFGDAVAQDGQRRPAFFAGLLVALGEDRLDDVETDEVGERERSHRPAERVVDGEVAVLDGHVAAFDEAHR